jgi:hypothetical protein
MAPIVSTLFTASTALVHINQNDPLILLETAYSDPTLRAFIRTELGDTFRVGGPSNEDIVLREDGIFKLNPDYAHRQWSKLGQIASIVVAAARGVHRDVEEGLPKDVRAFEWLRKVLPSIYNSNNFPHLSLAQGTTRNVLLAFRSYTAEGIIELVNSFDSLVLFYCQWVRDMIKLSIVKGMASEVNWGNHFGISCEEFLNRVAPDSVRFTHPKLINDLDGNYEHDLALILHPTHSSLALKQFLMPYKPLHPNIEDFVPKAYITSAEEDKEVISQFLLDSVNELTTGGAM